MGPAPDPPSTGSAGRGPAQRIVLEVATGLLLLGVLAAAFHPGGASRWSTTSAPVRAELSAALATGAEAAPAPTEVGRIQQDLLRAERLPLPPGQQARRAWRFALASAASAVRHLGAGQDDEARMDMAAAAQSLQEVQHLISS